MLAFGQQRYRFENTTIDRKPELCDFRHKLCHTLELILRNGIKRNKALLYFLV